MRRLMIASVTAALMVASVTASGGAYAAPHSSTTRTGCDTGATDFDGNGGADLAVTGPDVDGDEDTNYHGGAVEVLMRHKDGMHKVEVPKPRKFRGKRVHDYASAITELDLSSHRRASQPCSDFAVTATYGHGKGKQHVIYMYRWFHKAHRFGVVATITRADIGLGIDTFGGALASQTMRTDRPTPRAHVLYTSARKPGIGDVVVRLMLSPRGAVVSRQLVAPGSTATKNVPIDVRTARHTFGAELLGTPDPDQVIISDPAAATGRGGGAVIIWNKGGKSQLITPKSAHLPPSHGHSVARRRSHFGAATYLTTESANAYGGPTYLMVGAPDWSAGHKYESGGAAQFRYVRSAKPARVVTAGRRWWTQATKGVAGAPDRIDNFGSTFTTLEVGPGPVVGVGVPLERDKRSAGVVDALGTGQVWRPSSIGQHNQRGYWEVFGWNLSSVHDINDRLPHDPFPKTSKALWASRVAVAAPDGDYVDIGLPTSTSRRYHVYNLPAQCSYESQGCGWGEGLTDSVGG